MSYNMMLYIFPDSTRIKNEIIILALIYFTIWRALQSKDVIKFPPGRSYERWMYSRQVFGALLQNIIIKKLN